MNTPVWTALAQVYDEKFEVLEIARLEYCRAIGEILDLVAAEVRMRSGPDDDLGRDATSQGDIKSAIDPLRKTLAFDVKIFDDRTSLSNYPILERKAQILARFSSPWKGGPDFLQLAIVSQMDPVWTNRLFDLAHKNPSVMEGSDQGASLEPNWIHACQIRLSASDFLESADKMLRRLRRLAHSVLILLQDSPDYRMQCVLVKCKKRLESELAIFPDFHCPPVNSYVSEGQCGNQWYLQHGSSIDGEFCGFWLAYEPVTGDLMLGINDGSGKFESDLKNAFKGAIGAEFWKPYEGYPGCSIMDDAKLRSLSDDEVLEVMMDAFKTFVRVMREPHEGATT